MANDVYVDSTTLMPVLKPKEANLPVQRENIQARLAFTNHVIIIMITADAEDQQKRKIDAQKDSVQRVFYFFWLYFIVFLYRTSLHYQLS